MPNWRKVIVSGSDASLYSLKVTNGITGSLFGTASHATSASYALTVTTASYALTASFALNGGGGGISTGSNTFYGDQIISGSLTVTGSASANIFLYPQTASNVVVPAGYNGLLITPIQLIGSSSVEIGSRLVIL